MNMMDRNARITGREPDPGTVTKWPETKLETGLRLSMIRMGLRPGAEVEDWIGRIGNDVIGSVARPVLLAALKDLEGRPFSEVVAKVRRDAVMVAALIGVLFAGTADGHYHDEEGVALARIKSDLRGLHGSALQLDEGLAQFAADHL